MAGWLGRLLGRGAPPAPPLLDAATLVAAGNTLLEAGRLAEAADRYAQALAADPQHLEAAVNLGFAQMQLGRADAAAEVLESVRARQPGNVDALFMLGTIAQSRGRHEEACDRLAAALQAQPGFLPAYAPLVRAWVARERADEASAVADAGLAHEPRDAELRLLRGNLHRLAGQEAEAPACFRVAVEAAPGLIEARLPLAQLVAADGDVAAAGELLAEALAHRPRSAELCRRLGDALLELGRADAACTAFAMALEHEPRDAAALTQLVNAELVRGRYDAARTAAQRLTEAAPDRGESWLCLGSVLSRLDQPVEAERALRRAESLAPADARPLAALGLVALHRGDRTAALATLGRAVALDPQSESIQSDRVFALSYAGAPDDYLAAARAYGALVAARAQPFADWPAAAADAAPGRLRVGIVSGDLRAHPVGYFIERLLAPLAAEGIDVVAFPTGGRDDEVTMRLRAACNGWVPLAGMADAQAAARIRAERIHVLLDLAGHSGFARLPVFAWRPAPVQASWLGYWASTGVPAIGHLIADPVSVPPGEEGLYTETVVRLPQTRLCFSAPGTDESHPVGPLPALRTGTVTFGSFQNLNKVDDAVLAAWKRVLDAVPGSRLRLQTPQTRRTAEAAVRARFAAAGISGARLLTLPPTDRTHYLAAYAEVDLLLDTFPFPGGTTTCEALWMGVPTVTLDAPGMAGHQGRLLMETAGLADWVARDVDGFVALAAAKAQDVDGLAALRRDLRARVLASPLFDAPGFAVQLAAVLRGLWNDRKEH